MKIMCIGDSLTCGYPFGEQYGWPYIINERTGWEMVNYGVSGQCSREILKRVTEENYFAQSADKVIILCGSNDFIFGICHILETLANILQMALMAKNAGITPIIAIPIMCNPLQATESWVDGTDYDAVNENLATLKDKLTEACKDFGFKVINLQDRYNGFYKFEDGLHPTVEGYKLMADIIEEELKHE